MAAPSHPKVPVFNSRVLAGVGRLIGSRAKSLKHNSASYNCERSIKDGFERLNLDVELHSRAIAKFSVWNDRVLWVGINIPGKIGWDFAFQGHGKLLSEHQDKFMRLVEASLLDIVTTSHGELAKKTLENWSCYGLRE